LTPLSQIVFLKALPFFEQMQHLLRVANECCDGEKVGGSQKSCQGKYVNNSDIRIQYSYY